jgi:phytanoyl-CoA dioxygenase PhyH
VRVGFSSRTGTGYTDRVMSVDLRTRRDEDVSPVDPETFFTATLPAALATADAATMTGAALLRLRPLTVEVDGRVWSLVRENEHVVTRPGPLEGGAHVRMTAGELTEIVHDRQTPLTLFTSGRLDMPTGGVDDLLDWWLVLRSALDGRPLHTPGAVGFCDRAGMALDLHRSFRLGDPAPELSHFLSEAGYLHLRGVFTEAEMAWVAADMDAAAPSYREGDGRSWWATTADGVRRLVRMQAFDERSPAAAALLADARLLALGAIPGDGHVHTGLEGNRLEALVKPLDVVHGISDVPWHKDCSLGRHSYECCSLTVGISVTGADATSGQLRVVAGSHRALVRPAHVRPGSHDLPEVDLPTATGDVTVHLSCTLHMSQPPTARERRVMYTGFRLPAPPSAAAARARADVRAARERAHTTVSQPPARQG